MFSFYMAHVWLLQPWRVGTGVQNSHFHMGTPSGLRASKCCKQDWNPPFQGPPCLIRKHFPFKTSNFGLRSHQTHCLRQLQWLLSSSPYSEVLIPTRVDNHSAAESNTQGTEWEGLLWGPQIILWWKSPPASLSAFHSFKATALQDPWQGHSLPKGKTIGKMNLPTHSLALALGH